MNCLRLSGCATTEGSENLALNTQAVLVMTLQKKERKEKYKGGKKIQGPGVSYWVSKTNGSV